MTAYKVRGEVVSVHRVMVAIPVLIRSPKTTFLKSLKSSAFGLMKAATTSALHLRIIKTGIHLTAADPKFVIAWRVQKPVGCGHTPVFGMIIK